MAEQTFRIVHFSDVHVGSRPASLGAWFDKRLLGSLNFYLRRSREVRLERIGRTCAAIQRLAPDAIVCTGDITSTGTPGEFEDARALIKPIRQLSPDRFIYVPGNHDLYVHDTRCREAVRETFSLLNGGRFKLDSLPARYSIGSVTFYLLNAAHPTNPFVCSGTFTDPMKQQLAAWLDEPRAGHRHPRVLVNHFPLRRADGTPVPVRRQLCGGEWLNDQLEAGRIDAALCGHIHRPYVRRLDPSTALEVCAGSVTIAGKLNVLDYSFETGRFTQFWVDVSADRTELIPMVEDLAPVSVE